MHDRRLYFMHPVNTYDTNLERLCERILSARLPEWTVENPNRPEHQAGYERYRDMTGKIGMDYFTEVVLPGMTGGVFLAFRDGMVGAGIWREADWLTERGFPVWEIIPASGTIYRMGRISDDRRLSVDGTRARIRMPDGSSKPY